MNKENVSLAKANRNELIAELKSRDSITSLKVSKGEGVKITASNWGVSLSDESYIFVIKPIPYHYATIKVDGKVITDSIVSNETKVSINRFSGITLKGNVDLSYLDTKDLVEELAKRSELLYVEGKNEYINHNEKALFKSGEYQDFKDVDICARERFKTRLIIKEEI